MIGEGGFGKVILVNRGAEFYAQKQVLKKRTNALEVELEKEIMTSESQFIVKLHGMISDFEYHYFLMGEVFCIEYSIKDPRSTTVFFRGLSRRRFDVLTAVEKISTRKFNAILRSISNRSHSIFAQE